MKMNIFNTLLSSSDFCSVSMEYTVGDELEVGA